MIDGPTKLDQQLLAPDGSLASRPHIHFTPAEAELLRQYRKFLEHHQLLEANFCARCWDGERDDGCRAFVTSERILIECRCRVRTFEGATY